MYASVVVIVQTAVAGWLPSALAAVVTAGALAGAYGRIARVVGRLVYSDADDPAAVVAALDARVARATAPEQLLPGIAEELAARLRVPGVRVAVTGSDAAPGTFGVLGNRAVTVPLVLDGTPLGAVDVALRRGRRLTARDRVTVEAAAGPVATAAVAHRLNEELRRSRLEVPIGRDDERRALRRRLHDELGPTLALAGHRLEAARDDAAQLDAAAGTLADAVAQVRAISRDLRPPALDELGLRAVLEAFAAGLALDARVTAPERIRPEAVEVALYRIAVEALLNAANHDGGTHVGFEIASDAGAWRLVVDDGGGGGSAADAVPGVGTRSMRERAEELVGGIGLGASPLGGSRVRAWIPVPRTAAV